MTRPRLLAAAGAAFLAAYLFWFAGAGIGAPFTDNDLMNLTFHLEPGFGKLLLANVTYWSSAYRPLGGLVYVASYRIFGFTPLPLRIFCFALILANLYLLYRVCARLAPAEVAALAVLLVTYHAWFVDLYYSSGTVYELLCFAFYFGAFGYYVGIRQRGRMLSRGQWVVFLALYIAALDSKELAVTLPLSVAAYEWFWHRWKELRGILWSAAVTVPYVIGKLSGPDSLAANPQYRPEIGVWRYIRTFDLYLNVLFYSGHFFRPGKSGILLALMALAAWRAKSRPMWFGWWFALFSVLPFIFIPHYSGFFMYLPAAGWALYIATALMLLRRRFAPRVPAAAVFVAVALALAPAHAAMSRETLRVFRSAELPTRELTAELRRVQPSLPHGAHVFFESDPFPPGNYWLTFLVRLNYDDPTIEVARRKDGAAEQGSFDAVFRWEDGKLVK